MATSDEIAKIRAELAVAQAALKKATNEFNAAVAPRVKDGLRKIVTEAGALVRQLEAKLAALLAAATPAANPNAAQNVNYNFTNTAGAGQGNRGVTQNRANDDKTNKKKTGTVKQTPAKPAAIPTTNNTVNDSAADGYDNRFARQGTAGPTQAGAADTPAAESSQNEKPGKRLKNPLANFSSYTYQLSLYMISPDAYEAFILSGRKNLNAINNITEGGKESIAAANAANAQNAAIRETNREAAVGYGSFTQGVGERGRNISPPAPSSIKTIKTGGAYLLAQSGGINNSGPNQRAPGFDLDFYIDDLVITQSLTPQDSQSATNVTNIEFKITEPYGFSFITRLKQAQQALQDVCPTAGYIDIKNPIRQFFILGIRFLGYDKDGNVIDTAEINKDISADLGTGVGLYERYFDITMSKIDFKIGGTPVVYTCEAKCIPGSYAFDTKKGIVWSGASITGKTVYDALLGGSEPSPSAVDRITATAGLQNAGSWGLLSTLNREQQKRLANKEIEIAAEWDIDWKGDSFERIAKATIVDPKQIDKRRIPTTSATSTKESNAVTAQTDKTPNKNITTITLGKGIPIIQAFDEIIKQSSYLEDTLNLLIKAETDNKITSDDSPEVINNKNDIIRAVSWYNLSAEIKVLGWDNSQKDFVVKTTFIVQPYTTPVTLSAYAGKVTPYPGPHKRYEHWFTGKNSEIMRYEQSLNSAFFNVAILGAGVTDPPPGGNKDIATVRNQPTGQSKTGKPNYNIETQNSYISSLHDPGSWAEVNLTILGDPDYLMQPAASSISTLYNKFYGTDGYSINPNSGQVFIEINFKEPVGYNNDNGILSINDSINIYPHPKWVQDQIDSRGGGVAMVLKTIVSKFSRGLFQQDLSGIPGIFSELDNPKVEEARESPFAAFNQVKTVPTTNAGTGSTATASAAKANQTKAKTGSPIALNGLSYTKNAQLMSAYVSRAPSGTAPTTTATATTAKSVATADALNKGTNTGLNRGKLNPWERLQIPPTTKPVQDQTTLNKKGSQDDDSGIINRGINTGLNRGKLNPWDRRD